MIYLKPLGYSWHQRHHYGNKTDFPIHFSTDKRQGWVQILCSRVQCSERYHWLVRTRRPRRQLERNSWKSFVYSIFEAMDAFISMYRPKQQIYWISIFNMIQPKTYQYPMDRHNTRASSKVHEWSQTLYHWVPCTIFTVPVVEEVPTNTAWLFTTKVPFQGNVLTHIL